MGIACRGLQAAQCRDEENKMAAAFFRIVLSVAAVAIATLAQAQHQQPPAQGHVLPPVATAIGSGPFSAEVYGAFRSMMQKDNSPKVELGQAMSKGTNIAIGAASGLRAEITVVDGRPIISYGNECRTCPPPHAETATLLVTGRVKTWAPSIELPNDLSGHALDRFIIEQANKAGLDMKQPFPIRIRGTLTNVAMHVIKSANPKFGGHGSAQPMALQEDINAEKTRRRGDRVLRTGTSSWDHHASRRAISLSLDRQRADANGAPRCIRYGQGSAIASSEGLSWSVRGHDDASVHRARRPVACASLASICARGDQGV
jgi:hypothetical protein